MPYVFFSVLKVIYNSYRMEPPHMHRPGVYDDFFGPGGPEDHFTSVFGQMDSMFQQLDAMMQGLQQHPGHFVITEEPGKRKLKRM